MRHARLLRIAGAAVALAAAGGVLAAPAYADDLSSGSWYYVRGHVQEAHDAGYSGKGVTVAVIDTQINPSVPTLRDANLDVSQTSFCYGADGTPMMPTTTDLAAGSHGTNVASLIAGTGKADPGQLPIRGVAPGARVLFFADAAIANAKNETTCLDKQGKDNAGALGAAIDAALDAHADIISISQSASISRDLIDAVARAEARGVPVMAALENDQLTVTWTGFPASANGAVAVQAFDAAGKIQTSGVTADSQHANLTDDVKVAAPGVGILLQGANGSWDQQRLGNGTSFATPIVAGFLAVLKSKYPKATGNQLLQSMIRNTGNSHHEPQWGNDFGYGSISLTAMLADDPLAYPDVNPFLDTKDPNAVPSAADVRAAGTGTAPAPTTARTGQSAAGKATGGGAAWLPWVIGGGALLVLLVVGGVVLTRRTARGRDGAAPIGADGTTREQLQTAGVAHGSAPHTDEGATR
ncbi:S8 family peptidase [Microbacterium sp. ASV81]|uniref:S8 family serine peptidase n=1 Tax=Microbacterium capsulatum TaxID=3041921 RepID=A0ABU0XJG6_9MICO|nr:S8 family serine peptidase [Microbacterium sp. ASV81]MDQ4215263.1 S8 family serine peptidase [Microbacterium sp. ASV81]